MQFGKAGAGVLCINRQFFDSFFGSLYIKKRNLYSCNCGFIVKQVV
jgi:hypothetical protein